MSGIFAYPTFCQNCEITISAVVVDATTHIPIPHAHIVLRETQQKAVSDSTGRFQLQNVCPQSYHMTVSHIGCQTEQIFIKDRRDTTLHIHLEHYSHLLDAITVKAEEPVSNVQESKEIQEQELIQNTHQSLASMLDKIVGVSTLKTGNGISKPVIHGLYGSRLTILNNGVPQSGQRWGNDHSPEIDPLVAQKIAVIKGVGALEYQGSSLGGVVLVKPSPITREPHLHGRFSYFFESNGNAHAANARLQKYSPQLAWKINATVKRGGDRRTPTYYLRNTGNREVNFAVQLEKSFSQKWESHLYLSSFNTQIGILRGSHIGNITDLQAALTRKIPFFTKQNFTYDLKPPRQEAHHQLVKWQNNYFISKEQSLTLTYAGQINIRKEFDVRRGGRSAIPTLHLLQVSHFIEAKYESSLRNEWELKTGIQWNTRDNTNNRETGINPLIPDALSYEIGLFALLKKGYEKIFMEWGGRYDYRTQNIVRVLRKEVFRDKRNFHNWNASWGIRYRWSPFLKLGYNIGYASRSPSISELYSMGLHQGVSGIEEGNIDLKIEKSLKLTLSVKGDIRQKLFFEWLGYYQTIANYIYLQPQKELRLTIRGAFPVFQYQQTQARIYGFDSSLSYIIIENWNTNFKYSYILGQDHTQRLPLIGMPSNNLQIGTTYQVRKLGKWQNLEFTLLSNFVFKQSNLLASQDFSPPPPSYHIISLRVAVQRSLGKLRMNTYIKVDNLWNVSYRDYLNRQRYFADAMGRNFIVGMSLVL